MTPVSEDGLVVNLWLVKSKFLYLPVEFLHVHSINTCLTERGAWTPQIYQGSCKTLYFQVAEFGRCLSVCPKAPFFWEEIWAERNNIKVVQTGNKQDLVTPHNWWHPRQHPQPERSTSVVARELEPGPPPCPPCYGRQRNRELPEDSSLGTAFHVIRPNLWGHLAKLFPRRN